MLLAIDIGNTNIVFGVFEAENWIHHWRIQTDPLKTADEYKVIFRSLIASAKIDVSKFKVVILSSVVPSLIIPFEEMLEDLINKSPICVGPEIYPKLPLQILNPYEIGSDLVANALAAYSKYGEFTTIIDFGTALTFITVGEKGRILGVSIAPGIKTAIDSLASKTAQLPHVNIVKPPSVLGKNTIHAIQSGVVIGYSGMVDSMIEKIRKAVGQNITVVATGGLSKEIAPLTNSIQKIEPLLTLDGLKLIVDYIG